jgi:hypothetical protein
MKNYERIDVEMEVFFISTVVGAEWSASRFSRFMSGERAHGGRVGHSTNLDYAKKNFFGPHRALRQSLYRLHYPGSDMYCHVDE